MATKRANPKKNKAARRPRHNLDMPGTRRARLELEDIHDLMMAVPPAALPLVGLASVWLWNMTQDRAAAAHCVDGCLTLHHALAEYGIASHVEAVAVRLEGRGGNTICYGENPRYNADGTFNGHTVLVATGAGRFLDPTAGQFSEVPATRQAMMPAQALLPTPEGLGDQPFRLARPGHTVLYLPLPARLRGAWRNRVTDAHAADYREAGANLAANVVATLLIPDMLTRARQAPYPRLQALLAALNGKKAIADRRGGFRFADPATGKETWLADIP